MTEVPIPEGVIHESRVVARRYLKRANDFEARGRVLDVLGLDERFAPALSSACAKTMIKFDLDEEIEALGFAPPESAQVLSGIRRLDPLTRKAHGIWLKDYALQILKDADLVYLDSTFGEGIRPPQIDQISYAIHELFSLLHISATNPHQNIPVQERFQNWAGNWRQKMAETQ